MTACSWEQDAQYTVTSLKEVLVVLTSAIELCRIASHWKHKPSADRPIVKCIKSEVYPRLRGLETIFKNEMHRLKVEERREYNRRTTQAKRENEVKPKQSVTGSSQERLKAMLRDMQIEFERNHVMACGRA